MRMRVPRHRHHCHHDASSKQPEFPAPERQKHTPVCTRIFLTLRERMKPDESLSMRWCLAGFDPHIIPGDGEAWGIEQMIVADRQADEMTAICHDVSVKGKVFSERRIRCRPPVTSSLPCGLRCGPLQGVARACCMCRQLPVPLGSCCGVSVRRCCSSRRVVFTIGSQPTHALHESRGESRLLLSGRGRLNLSCASNTDVLSPEPRFSESRQSAHLPYCAHLNASPVSQPRPKF